MTIQYKVVHKDTRLSTTARGVYSVVYNKGTTVKALPYTLGIMVFKKRWQAQHFMTYLSPSNCMILRVKTFTKGIVPKKISMLIRSHQIDMFYKKAVDRMSMTPPNGTICYDMVKVLD